jgi:hypothetical protein
MNKQELKQLIQDSGCNYSDATIDYLVDNTSVKLIPSFSCNNTVKHNSISKYIDYFFNQLEHQQVLIDNKDVYISDIMTKFKVGEVVYYFDKNTFALIKGQITSIDNKINLTSYFSEGPSAYSVVGIKRLDEDVDFVYDYIRNEELFLTIDEGIESLINNTFNLEQRRKQQAYNDLVQDELAKFNSVNYE